MSNDSSDANALIWIFIVKYFCNLFPNNSEESSFKFLYKSMKFKSCFNPFLTISKIQLEKIAHWPVFRWRGNNRVPLQGAADAWIVRSDNAVKASCHVIWPILGKLRSVFRRASTVDILTIKFYKTVLDGWMISTGHGLARLIYDPQYTVTNYTCSCSFDSLGYLFIEHQNDINCLYIVPIMADVVDFGAYTMTVSALRYQTASSDALKSLMIEQCFVQFVQLICGNIHLYFSTEYMDDQIRLPCQHSVQVFCQNQSLYSTDEQSLTLVGSNSRNKKHDFNMASSNTSILLFRIIALAKHTNCLCPTLKLDPPSDIFEFRPSDKSSTTFLSSTFKY
ncbi:hypothetical protein AGLY_006082 [Aphis glycines]|uniref:Uncharacterized protein n=1 Tax=Aphis glycines TaxID=307491 RepID=A0A6G0TTN1_APHGL|nr:hypothetical protein AGLY_006082 [Aphis glycines]